MKARGDNLNRAYKKLPGTSIVVDASKCDGCALCVEKCFASEMHLVNGKAMPGDDCKACGRCVELCPKRAIEIRFDDEEKIFQMLARRIKSVAEVGLG